MVYLTWIVCILLLAISVRKKNNYYNPVFLFLCLWSIIIFLNMLGLFGINKASNQTYYFILLGLISISFGEWTAELAPRVKFRFGNKVREEKKSDFNYTMIWILMVVAGILLFIDFAIVVNELIKGTSLVTIRTWYNSTYSSGSNKIEARRGFAEQVLRVVLIEPFLNALPILCALNLFSENRKKKIWIPSLFLLVLSVISSGGGRLAILSYFVSFVMAYCINRNKEKTKNIVKQKKRMQAFGIIGFIAVLVLTIKRSATGFVKEAYYYFSMCVPLLDRWLPDMMTSTKTKGMLSAFGIFRIPFLILDKLGFDVPTTYTLAQSYIVRANYFYSVGARSGNSFVSPYYYLYLDAGIFGIFLGMFLLGYFSTRVYKRVIAKGDLRDKYILLLLIQAVLMTFVRWQFIGTAFCMSFVYLPLFIRKRK